MVVVVVVMVVVVGVVVVRIVGKIRFQIPTMHHKLSVFFLGIQEKTMNNLFQVLMITYATFATFIGSAFRFQISVDIILT